MEDVAFDEGVDVLADVEGVSGVVEPVVVVGVPIVGEFELRGSAGGVVDVVACEGDVVALSVAETGNVSMNEGGWRVSHDIHGPVVVAVAGGGPACPAVKLGVGDGHLAGWDC